MNAANCLYVFCSVKEMRSQFLTSVDMQIFLKLCNLYFSTCFKVCSIQGIEVVLTTRRNLFFNVELQEW